MKLTRWAMCVASFALMGGIASAEDYVDIQAMQAKLAAQEARLNDLQAKMYGSACEEGSGVVADGLTSLRKNATVTIGGTINTRYDYVKGKIDTSLGDDGFGNVVDTGVMRNVYDYKGGALSIADSKLEIKVDVNEHFDAYMKFDLQDGHRGDGRSPANVTENAWIRWKNICNSGFGVLVGRDGTKFGGIDPYGRWDSWTHGIGDMAGVAWAGLDTNELGVVNTSMLTQGMGTANMMPDRGAIGSIGRTLQVTPYWETQDGSFKIEASFFQAPEYYNHRATWRDGSTLKQRHMNDGGGISGRITWKPIEGLKIVGSVANEYADHRDGMWSYPSGDGWDIFSPLETSRNTTSTYLGFEYRPCFFNKVNVFATWLHTWNGGWVKDQSSDSITFGAGFDILDNLTLYGLGEHVSAKSDQAKKWGDAGAYKGKGWAYEVGMKYTTSFGVWANAGWRHEKMDYQNDAGYKHTKLKADSFYTTLGFDF